MTLFASIFTYDIAGQTVVRAMPILLVVLCVLAIAYRYYSAFLAARVAMLDDSRQTPAHTFNDGQNYHPTNKWVLFGHHFAAISGAGPLIGPVLAIQYGYLPGLLWLVIGVCLAGAVQDMLVLAASVRRGGKSLAQIALTELGRPASIIVSLAILVIVVIALAGLGFVVVKALGGEEVRLPTGMRITAPTAPVQKEVEGAMLIDFPEGCTIRYTADESSTLRPERFQLKVPQTHAVHFEPAPSGVEFTVPEKSLQLVPGSSWGTFTIACTIPIALFVGLWMYRIRKGHVVEASIIGGVGVLAATIAGSMIPGSFLEPYFSLSKHATILALCAYGFIASVLPVWMLLCPRDYISSFLKVGTIALLVIGVLAANPALPCPPINRTFAGGGPTFAGGIFPFVFICVMCGAISGFHALVSSGTTPKMIDKESQVRLIGYGSMLMEGLVGVVALIAAASLPMDLYYDINVDLDKASAFQSKLETLYKEYGLDEKAGKDRMHRAAADSLAHLNIDQADLGQIEELVGGESLRGRTGGAVTLAVGMARIFTKAMHSMNLYFDGVMKYWYHFAIMFEALFILTTIDTGTRIARFLMQETLGKVFPRFERADWLPGAVLSTGVVTAGWGALIATGSIGTIWPMFGIANQLLAVLGLCLVTTMLINSGRGKYAPVTLLPMLFVTTTTMSAGVIMAQRFTGEIQGGNVLGGTLNLGLTLFVMVSVSMILLLAVSRWYGVLTGIVSGRL
ncbi:MAG TPA: carbon starvation protein A [Gemmataceae bacterium]|nr:carbon starvation protein A [Gemmataceae bacterium]